MRDSIKKQAMRPQYAPAPCKWWLVQPYRAFSVEVITYVNDADLHVPLRLRSDLRGRCAIRWCGSLCCICIPSLKFVDHPVPKVWPISGHSLVTLTFVLGTGAECQPWHGQLPVNFGGSATSLCRVMGRHASNWRRDVITLTFDLWGHCACQWCGSLYSIRSPSLKFVGLPFPKIWLIFGHGVKRPADLWPFDL